MASTQPHLLSLPREIRNRIYDYVFHELDLDTIREIGGITIIVTITNAPCVNLLLVHSQLRNEYLESKCFTNLSAIIREVGSGWPFLVITFPPTIMHMNNVALTSSKNATLQRFPEYNEGQGLQRMIDGLVSRGLKPHTLRIIQQRKIATYEKDKLPESRALSASLQIAELPRRVFDLPILQHVTGVVIQYVKRLGGYNIAYELQAYVYSMRPSVANIWDEAKAMHTLGPYRKRIYIFSGFTKKPGKMVIWDENSTAP